MTNYSFTFTEAVEFRHSLDPEALYRISVTLNEVELQAPRRHASFWSAEREGVRVAMERRADLLHVIFSADPGVATHVGLCVRKMRTPKAQ